jgi:hypothetical protein
VRRISLHTHFFASAFFKNPQAAKVFLRSKFDRARLCAENAFARPTDNLENPEVAAMGLPMRASRKRALTSATG